MAVTRDTSLEFDLISANTFAAGITFGNDKLWVVDAVDDKVYAYNSDGTRSSGDDFDFDSTISVQGITFANGKLYILSNTFNARKVWAYNTDGTRSADDDFNLPSDQVLGITFGNNKFYITQFGNPAHILVYSSTGTRLTDEGFNTDAENTSPQGITFAYNKLYVTDSSDQKVYVYGTDGTRYADEDFGTVDGNPLGITFNDNTFFVLGNEQDKVFAFSVVFTRTTKSISARWSILEPVSKSHSPKWSILQPITRTFSALWDITQPRIARSADDDFNLDGEAGNPRGITWDKDNEMFWVVDSTDDEVYAHDSDGVRVSGSDFTLSVTNALPLGICYVNGYLYVLDRLQRKFFVYNTSGVRQTSLEFDTLGADQDGCTNYNGKMYVIDRTSREIYVYSILEGDTYGDRLQDDQFRLHEDHVTVRGLAIAYGRFYAVDSNADTIFAYNLDGTRHTSSDYALDSENGVALGMTFGNGNKFWVANRNPNKVFAYQLSVTRTTKSFSPKWSILEPITRTFSALWNILSNEVFSGSFDLDGENSNSTGITIGTVNGVKRLYVLDNSDRKLYAYNFDGTRYSAGDINVTAASNMDGVVFHDGKFYVLSFVLRKVFVYSSDGTRLSDEDFDTLGDSQRGMAAYDGKLYILQGETLRLSTVYVYQFDGTRVQDEDIELTSAVNTVYRGIIIVDDIIYLTDAFTRDSVDAYSIDGDSLSSQGFHLGDVNNTPTGITYDNGTFFIVDNDTDRVFEYSALIRVIKDFLSKWSINSYDSEIPIPYLQSGFTLDQTCTGITRIDDDLLILKNTVIERHTTEGVSVDPNYNYNSLNTGRNGAFYNRSTGILFVLDRGISRIYQYDLSAGTHSFLSIGGIQGSGIIFHDNKYHITNTNGSVRTLNSLGQTESNTTLHADNTSPQGITRHAGKYYIPDNDGTVYAYNNDFSPYSAGNFSLRIGDDDRVGGITVVGNVFFVLINDEVRVYAPIILQSQKTLKWSIKETISKSVSASWELVERIEKSVSARWDTIERVVKLASTQWSISEQITKSFSALWDILEGTLEITRSPSNDIDVAGLTNIQGLGSRAGRLYVLNLTGTYVFCYNTDGSRQEDEDFDLQVGNSAPHGLSFYDGKWYVLNDSAEGARIYRYNEDGTADGNLGIVGVNPISARSITVFGDKIYLGDNESGNKRIIKLNLSGNVEFTRTLNYISNARPLGLSNYNDKLFIADNDDNVYGLNPDGTRYEGGDFPMDAQNQSPSGMTETNDTFYIADRADNVLYAYSIGTAIISRLFSASWGILERVEKSVSTKWSISESISKSFNTLWSIGETITRGLSSRWSILERVESSRPTQWSILQRVSKSASVRWGILERVRKSFNALWVIGGIIARGFNAKWDVLERVESSHTFRWSITESISKSISASWGILERVSKSVSTRWSILNSITKAITARWWVISLVPADVFTLDPENTNASGIAYANELLYVTDSNDNHPYVYALDGTRFASADFNYVAPHDKAIGITSANNNLYVLDHDDDDVYAYSPSGVRLTGNDFTLDSDNAQSRGITFVEGKFYIVDITEDKVFVYNEDGTRSASDDFDLDSENANPTGITTGNGILYVIDKLDQKAYGYQLDGTRSSGDDFDLHSDNNDPRGITFANNRLFVIGAASFRLHSYTLFIRRAFTVPWSIVQRVTSSQSTRWGILQRVSKSVSVRWGILERVRKAFSVIWSLGGGVVRGFNATWDIAERVVSSRTSKWSISSSVTNLFSTQWSITESVSKLFSTPWSILERIENSLSTQWSILTSITNSHTASWGILERVSKSASIRWGILERVSRSFRSLWSIGGIISKGFAATWDIVERVKKSFNALWDIDGLTVRRFSASWDIDGISTDFRNVSYFTLDYSLETEPIVFYKIAPESIV